MILKSESKNGEMFTLSFIIFKLFSVIILITAGILKISHYPKLSGE